MLMEPRKLLDQLYSRMVVILGKQGSNLPEAMAMVLDAAASADLHNDLSMVRQDSVETFASDLLLENPQAMQWAASASESLRPLKISDLDQLVDAIQPY